SKEINELLKTIPDYISKKDIAGANIIYDKIETIFKSIPEGFLVQKSELQNSILKMSEKIAKSLDTISSREFDEKHVKILRMIKSMKDYVAKADYDLAFAEYEEIISIYNQLPSGFLKKKTELREGLLTHYKNILRGTDAMLLDRSESAIAKKYDEMLQILIRMHQHIESREFDLWEASYDHLIDLYNNMPIGFLQTKTKIIEEVIDMHKKFEMLEMIKKAEEYSRKDNLGDLSNLLNKIHALYHTLLEKSNEDKQLFDFIYKKYSSYLNLIHGKAHTIQKPVVEHKDINNFREKLSTTEKSLSNINLDYVKPV
ncbi:hypothetical protein HQ529_05420, partial [Candidatus Woesearchaeota archaeon]|nr:hypothetical protein [Candidatus Woesearchaeota archaeon]